MNLRRVWIWGCVAWLLASCGQANYEDVSNSDAYRNLIGTQYRTREELLVIGVTRDQNYKRQVDYYVVTTKPGFGGPEFVTRSYLPPSSVIQVSKAIRCTNCLPPYDGFVIDIISNSTYQGAEIHLDFGVDVPVLVEDQGRMRLNPVVFEAITS